MNPKDKHADWLLKPTANELADGLAKMYIEKDVNGLFNKRIQNMLRHQEVEIERITSKYEEMLSQQQAEIDNLAIVKYLNGVTISKLYAEIEALNQRIERMIENASHHEGIAHAGGFETGYQAGLRKAQENG